jgi:hypothetical protein
MHPIPTVRELAARGLAHAVDWTREGVPTRWRVTEEGHALLGRLMRENGLEAQINGTADWTQPASRIMPALGEGIGKEQ